MGQQPTAVVLLCLYVQVCTVCNEPFEQFWEEEEEAWHFRDAMKMGGKVRW